MGNDLAALALFLAVKQEMFASQFGTNFDQSELKSQFVSVFPELVAPQPSMWKWSPIVHVLLQRKQAFFR